jgi:hypothetical protein
MTDGLKTLSNSRQSQAPTLQSDVSTQASNAALSPEQSQALQATNALLERAGLGTAVGGLESQLKVSDGETPNVGAQKYSGQVDLTIAAPKPPTIALSPELATGAESFAGIMDGLVNDLAANSGQISVTELAKKLLNNVGAQGTDTQRTSAAGEAQKNTLSDSNLQVDLAAADLSADVLLSLFLKLNINDPNNSVETHAILNEVSTTLRQKAIDEGIKKAENAIKMRAEAEAYADKMGFVMTIIEVVMIVITVILTIISFGAAAAPMAMAMAAVKEIATTALKEGLKAAVKLVLEMVKNMVKTMVKQMVKGLVKDAVKETVKEGVKEAVKEAVKEGTKEAVQKAVQEAVSKFGKEAVSEVLQEAVTEALTEVAQETGSEIVKEAISEILSEGLESTLEQALETAVEKGLEKGLSSGIKNALRLTQLIGGVAKGGIDNQVAQKSATADLAQNGADRARLRAEIEQQNIEEESAIIQMILESKNQVVEAVMKMMQASAGTQSKLNNASMSS